MFALVFIFWLIINVLIARKFESVAVMKGYSEEESKGYFWWCFWLEAVGWIMVIALPDKKSQDYLLKGLTPKIVSLLDSELSNINRVIKRTLNRA